MLTQPSKYHFGLIGYPLEHSLSPVLHQAAFKGCSLEGTYRLFPIPPGENAEKDIIFLLHQMRDGIIHGLNVTIPHKQAVIPYLDDLSREARAIGAVNTIVYKNRKLIGYNTDAPGLISDLKRLSFLHQYETIHPRVLILGAGGAARAVAYALYVSGYSITIAARRITQAQKLVNTLQPHLEEQNRKQIDAIRLDAGDLLPALDTFDLIVNATPVGMYPNVDVSPWPANLRFPNRAAVYDLVYNPIETALISSAKASGLKGDTGLGMLVYQAAKAFKLWTNCDASTSMWKEVIQ